MLKVYTVFSVLYLYIISPGVLFPYLYQEYKIRKGEYLTGIACRKHCLESHINDSLVPRPHLFLEVGLVNNEHFLGCAESACMSHDFHSNRS